jgi:hypothetical protein
VFAKQFHAEIRRILALLERIRRTRRRVRLLIATETGASRRKTVRKAGGVKRLVRFRARVAAARPRPPAE